MISGNQHDLCVCQSREKIVYFFQFPKKGLSVEQISGNQKKIRLFFLADPDNPFKGIPDFLRTLLSIRCPGIRVNPQM